MNFHCKLQGIHTGFEILIIHVAPRDQVPVYMQNLRNLPNGGQVQKAFADIN